MTEKLFYHDSHMRKFTAKVLTVCPGGETYEVVLDRTAFFPTGGGQSADTGVLGGVRVLDVQERDEKIVHITDQPLVLGENVEGEIDWDERFSKMQQHSGEHLISGLVHSRYGYDNVGFHMGAEAVTMDFNGELTMREIRKIETLANRILAENLLIVQHFPTREELQIMDYRSKKELDGQVRIIEIPGYDRCACCAPHVKATGEIGLIRLLNVQRYKGGCRVSMLCGMRALQQIQQQADSIRRLSVLFSAKEEEVADEAERLYQEMTEKKQEITRMEQEILRYKAEKIPARASYFCTFEKEISGDQNRYLMNQMLQKEIGVAAAFSGDDTSGYRYVIGSQMRDLRPLAERFRQNMSGRGGGKPEMIQGFVGASKEALEKEVREWALGEL